MQFIADRPHALPALRSQALIVLAQLITLSEDSQSLATTRHIIEAPGFVTNTVIDLLSMAVNREAALVLLCALTRHASHWLHENVLLTVKDLLALLHGIVRDCAAPHAVLAAVVILSSTHQLHDKDQSAALLRAQGTLQHMLHQDRLQRRGAMSIASMLLRCMCWCVVPESGVRLLEAITGSIDNTDTIVFQPLWMLFLKYCGLGCEEVVRLRTLIRCLLHVQSVPKPDVPVLASD